MLEQQNSTAAAGRLEPGASKASKAVCEQCPQIGGASSD